MVTVHPHFIVDEKQNRKSVVLSLADWDRIVEALEELDDLRAYDEVKAGCQDRLPFDKAVREIQQEERS